MNIAILDIGKRGMAMGQLMSTTRHGVVFGGPSSVAGHHAAETFVQRFGRAVQGGSISQAIRVSDIIVLTQSFEVSRLLVEDLTDIRGKIVIDATLPHDGEQKEGFQHAYVSDAEWIQEKVRPASIVKAFNTISASVFALGGTLNDQKVQVFCASDDDEALRVVMRVVADAGLQPVDVGNLQAARYLEPLAALNARLANSPDFSAEIAPVWIQGKAA